jgi:N-acetylneuraminic acid mutarotase
MRIATATRASAVVVLALAGALLAGCTPPPANTFRYSQVRGRPFAVTEGAVVTAHQKLYTFGGFDDRKPCCTETDRAFMYDPATDSWHELARMPHRGVSHAGTTTDGTDIYYAGGYIPNADWTAQVFGTREVWRYNVATDDYTRMPDLPVERAAGALKYLRGHLYYFGGTNRARTVDAGDHWVLNLNHLELGWQRRASLPNPRHHLGSAVVGGLVYAIGGDHHHDANSVQQDEVDAYDPATDTWHRVASLPTPRSHIAGATFALDGRIVVAGGEHPTYSSLHDVLAYNPATNHWDRLTSLPFSRGSGVASRYKHGFFYIGGAYAVRSTWRAVVDS